MKPFAEEVRELLNTLPAEFYNNQVGSRTNKEQDDEDRETINNTMLSICEAVIKLVKNRNYKRDWEDEPIGSLSGYKKAIEDILKEIK